MLNKMHFRRKKGQSMVVLIVFLLVFFILLLGMAAFEFARYSLCCQQFQHCVDIAALGGAAGLASSQTTDQVAAQNVAIQTAQWMMEQNYILDKSLNGMTSWNNGSSIPSMPATANRANMAFTWVDPETGAPTGVVGDQKVFRVSGTYAYPPLVGSWIGLGNNTLAAVVAIGNGGGVMLDVVLCFDLSGSIDDSTKVTIVDRWKPTSGDIVYTKKRENTLYVATSETSDTGSPCNALYPQFLNNASMGGFNVTRRGQTQGAPPPATSSSTGTTFTDIVVNLDENNVFGGGTFGGLSFPNVGTLVEASRGNLESTTVAGNAGVNYSALGVTPQSGYYRTYWEQAQIHRHPLYDAQASSANFFQIMNNSTNAHFGFVGFSTNEGTTLTARAIHSNSTQNHTFPNPPASGNIPISSNVSCPIPLVQLNPAPGAAGSNFSAISAILPLPPTLPSTVNPQLTAQGSTDINGALNRAMNMLTRTTPTNETGQWPNPQNRSRVGARRAIVLFTDGRPTIDNGPYFVSGSFNTSGHATAQRAGNLGIPIYCIGLAQVAAMVPQMNAHLGQIASNSGGRLYVIPPGTGQAAALDRAFSDIARSLVALTR